MNPIHFFIYETVKIFLLLTLVIFIVSFIRTFLPPEKTKQILCRGNKLTGSILASVLGIFTPFCSCSAVPLFLGFVEAGVPLSATFSFLVSSPMINEVALVMLWGLFGWKVAVIYISSGLLIAVVSGLLIGLFRVESLLERDIVPSEGCCPGNKSRLLVKERLDYALKYTRGIIGSIWLYVIVGIAIGAFIHGYVPSDFLVKAAGRGNFFAVPLATILGIPLYSNAAGVIPVVSALTEKGVATGTALAFMMAVTALSLPEFIILRKIMKPKLIFIFAVIVGTGIMFTGYLFNVILH